MSSDAQADLWYVAVLVVQARVGEGWQDDVLIDHQVRLLRASDPETAYQRALMLGASAKQTYRNGEGEEVVWTFVGLADLDVLSEQRVEDGIEVYSWRSRGDPTEAVVPKERLTVFWLAANAHRKVSDLLD